MCAVIIKQFIVVLLDQSAASALRQTAVLLIACCKSLRIDTCCGSSMQCVIVQEISLYRCTNPIHRANFVSLHVVICTLKTSIPACS